MTTDCVDLGEIVAFGNWLHGSWKRGVGFRNRSGAAFDSSVLGAGEINNVDLAGTDAHLVDFDMPAISTPAEDAALGLERWNKAVLHGRGKYHCIRGTKGFGQNGWPYKSADGTVWRLAVYVPASGQLAIWGAPLDSDFSNTMVQLATFSVPDPDGLPVTVTFNPKGGGQAALHAYSLAHYTRWCRYVLEVSVTGGSMTVPPSISGAVTITEAASFATNGYEDLPGSNGWRSDDFYTTGDEYPSGDGYDRQLTHYLGPPSSTSPGRAGEWLAVMSVCWDASGNRHVLSVRAYDDQKEIYSDYQTSRVDTQHKNLANPWTTVSWSGQTTWKRTNSILETYQLLRDGAVIVELKWNWVRERLYLFDYNSLSGGVWADVTQVTSDTETNTGNLRDSAGNNNIFATVTSVLFSRHASNVIAITGSKDGSNRIFGYIGPESAAVFGYGVVVDTYPNLPLVALDPITGAFDKNTIRYF